MEDEYFPCCMSPIAGRITGLKPTFSPVQGEKTAMDFSKATQ